MNICDQANLDAVLPETRRRNIGVIAKRPIANAAWKGTAHQRGLYVDYTKTYIDRFAIMKDIFDEMGFEGATAETWPEIALRFTVWQPGVTTAVVGTTRSPR